MAVISVDGLGKAYRQYASRWSRLAEWCGLGSKHTLKWVLRNITFDVGQGEAVGIIGLNGAGKSTLLKMITGTTQPTEGSVQVRGKLAALLELGMGFHPEFTGRQNVMMAGQLLGFTKAQLVNLLPSIEAFAELGDYIDRPLRVYSSGMQVRLAFSLATAVRPDVLIVDEALAVGDAQFQHKCVDRIRHFSVLGTSLLFVSHDPATVRNLCKRAILLNGGRVAYDGDPDTVLDYYNALLADGVVRVHHPAPGSATGVRSGNGRARIESVRLLDNHQPAAAFIAGRPMRICLQIRATDAVGELCVGISVRDRYGNVMFGTNTRNLRRGIGEMEPGRQIEVEFELPVLAVGAGHYSLSAALHDPASHIVETFDWWDKAAFFEVLPDLQSGVEGACYVPVLLHVHGDVR